MSAVDIKTNISKLRPVIISGNSNPYGWTSYRGLGFSPVHFTWNTNTDKTNILSNPFDTSLAGIQLTLYLLLNNTNNNAATTNLLQTPELTNPYTLTLTKKPSYNLLSTMQGINFSPVKSNATKFNLTSTTNSSSSTLSNSSTNSSTGTSGSTNTGSTDTTSTSSTGNNSSSSNNKGNNGNGSSTSTSTDSGSGKWFNWDEFNGVDVAKSAAAPAIQLGFSLANKGVTNETGQALSTVGNMASAIPVVGWAANAALQLGAGIANSFTDRLNKDYAKAKNQEIINFGLLTSNAKDYASLLNDYRTFNTSSIDVGDKENWGDKGAFVSEGSSERTKARNAAISLYNTARKSRLENLSVAANNINSNNMLYQLGNLTALGGPIEVALANEYSNSNRIKALNTNSANPFTSTLGTISNSSLGSLFAFGGDTMSNGADFGTGMIHVGAGDTHEANPYEGVPMGSDEEGTPNLVEEDETVYDDYVYSNRLTVPELKAKKDQKLTQELKVLNKFKNMTYADAAKKAEHLSGIDERPNDPIARRGFESVLQILANSQEKERAIQELYEKEEGISQKKQALENMSAEEFAARKQQQEEQELLMQLAQEQQALAEQLALMQQQGQQPSPEEILAMQLQAMQLPLMAYGGYFAEGGLMTPEELLAAQALVELQQAELAQAEQELAMASLRLMQDLTTELPQTEEAPKQELAGIDSGTPADEMSTSELNETIDLIYQWAKANGEKELAKRARKAKRASRESKEDFVDEALEDIDSIELEKSAELNQEPAQEELNTTEDYGNTATPEVMLAQAEQQAQLLSSELEAAQELNALTPNEQLFAQGGQMSLQELIQLLDTFMELISKTNDKQVLEYYTAFTLLKNSNDLNNIAKAYKLASLLYLAFNSQLQEQYALGGSMDLNNSDSGNIYEGNKIFAGKELDLDTFKKLLEVLEKDEPTDIAGKNFNGAKAYLYIYDLIKDRDFTKTDKALQRMYRKKGIDISKLNTAAKSRYLEDINAYRMASLLKDYDAKKDKTLNINGDYINGKGKANLGIFNNAATYDDLITRGAKPVDISNGKAAWNALKGYSYVNDAASDYWTNPANYTTANGVYDYKTNAPKNWYDKYKVADYIAKLNDLNYTFANANVSGNIPSTPDSSDAARAIENDTTFKSFWNDMKEHWNDDNETVKSIRQAIASRTGLNWEDVTADQAYKAATTGNVGFYHTAISPNTVAPTATRYVYTDPTGKSRFIYKPEGEFTIKGSAVHNVNGVNMNDIEVGDTDLNRQLYKIGDKVLDVTNVTDGTFTPTTDQLVSDTSNLGTGYNGTTSWVTTDDATGNYYTQDKYVIPKSWPLYAGAGILGAAALYNILSKPNYDDANALIKASETIGLYTPIKATPIGEYVPYTPYDINYVNNQANASNQAAIRLLLNASNGNQGALMAGLLALNYNYGLGIGNNYRQAMEYNDKNRLETATFNRATDLYNSEADLKALMANQDARLKAGLTKLEGLSKAYAMKQQIDANRQNAINTSLSGLALGLYNGYLLSIINGLVGWRLNHQDRLGNYRFDANGNPLEYNTETGKWEKVKKSNGGKLIKRHKGVSF